MKKFHRLCLTSFCGESRWIIYFHRVDWEASLQGFKALTSCMPPTSWSSAPTLTYFYDISCEFKSDSVNVGKPMRWSVERNAVNFCKKCGEMRWIFFCRIHRNHRISYKRSPINLDPGLENGAWDAGSNLVLSQIRDPLSMQAIEFEFSLVYRC